MDTIKINREIELVNLELLINNPQTVDSVREFYNNVFEYSNNDSIFLEFKHQLSSLGLNERDFDLYYSLSYSQGDGLCIRSKKRYDYHSFTKEIIERLKDYLEDYHEDSEEIDDNLKEIEKELNGAFSGFYLDLCSELEDFGYKLLEPTNEEMLERFLDYYNETELFVSSDFEIYNKKGEQL